MRRKLLALLTSLLLLTSCSVVNSIFGSGETESQTSTEEETSKSGATESGAQIENNVTSVPVESLTPPTSGVEIVWQVPTTPTDGYVIRYGFSESELDREVRLRINEITRTSDTEHGEIFRYVIRSLPNDRTVYVSLAATQGDTISPPTKVFEVKPEVVEKEEPDKLP